MKKTDGWVIIEYNSFGLENQNKELRQKLQHDLLLYGKCVSRMKDGERVYVPYSEWTTIDVFKQQKG